MTWSFLRPSRRSGRTARTGGHRPRCQLSGPVGPDRVEASSTASSRRPDGWRTSWAIACPTGSCRCISRASREGRATPSRIVLIGCGGIGSQLDGPLARYLASRPEPRPLLVLVDGDAFEAGNLNRQACAVGDLGTNKAEALARVARDARLAVQVVPEHVTEANVGQLVREGDLVLLAVDALSRLGLRT